MIVHVLLLLTVTKVYLFQEVIVRRLSPERLVCIIKCVLCKLICPSVPAHSVAPPMPQNTEAIKKERLREMVFQYSFVRDKKKRKS